MYTENTEIALKIWNFQYLPRTRKSNGEEGRTLRSWHSCSHVLWFLSMLQQLLGAKWVCQTPLDPLENQQVHAPRHPNAWFWWGFCLFVLGVLLCLPLLCERRNRKQDPFSNWLTQTLQDKSWTLTLEKGLSLAPELKAPEKIKCFLLSQRGPSWRALVHTTALVQKRYVFLVSLFSFD